MSVVDLIINCKLYIINYSFLSAQRIVAAQFFKEFGMCFQSEEVVCGVVSVQGLTVRICRRTFGIVAVTCRQCGWHHPFVATAVESEVAHDVL